jgi:CDP-diacylglycerol--glycerol-3-phosphate 3-phosphatidyltransferase
LTISNESRARIKGIFEPIALAMGRAGLTPDALTFIGFAITVVGAVLVSQQLWLIGGLVVFFGGVFDMFDGTLARATGQASPLGGFMDSVFDRAGEVVVYVGIVAALQAVGIADGTLLAAATMGAAVMVSYARAKSDAHGFTAGTGLAAVGVMPREVRLVILSLGLVLAGILGADMPTSDGSGAGGGSIPTGIAALFLALGVILVGSIITVIQRTMFVRRQAKQPHPTTTNPQ